ncbi:MAG: glycosyltransferase, partial [Deltaproteobacteria bacterium]|nr:glycosyltransferase [Deltaproteobacteria bacterium]
MPEKNTKFRDMLKDDLNDFVNSQKNRFAHNDSLIIDLHCHDYNSNVPDELLGRILHWPETWVTTDEVRQVLTKNDATAITITNHNNARSCFDLLERGIDVLVGAEFTCTVPDFEVHVHVLTYGFSPTQEERLNKLRSNIYKFLDYTCEQNIVTTLAHPLYFYSTKKVPTLPLLEKLTLLFDNFEVLNGQRDTWQNLLVIAWLQSLSELRIAQMSKRAGIAANTYSKYPIHKIMTGGSDDHMALFVGTTANKVYIPELEKRLKKEPRSALVLEALRQGNVAPFGSYTAEEKLAASFLDYFCQIVKNAQDPGLVRMLLHQGSAKQKIWAFLIANAIFELRQHRYTSRFIDAAHEALHGTGPGFLQKYAFAKDYRPLVKELDLLATTYNENPQAMDEQIRNSVPAIFHELINIIAGRIKTKVEHYEKQKHDNSKVALQEFIERLELPANLRSLLGDASNSSHHGINDIDLRAITQGLPFPALAAAVIGGSTYTSTKVLFANRPLLDEFSSTIGRYRHPRRVLWLTDTFADQNGVASSLRLLHAETVSRKLPIDFVVCHNSLTADKHLHVLNSVVELPLPYYEQQPLRLFDIMELQKIFLNGGYDRVVCSTEGIMGLAALFLKHAFSVPTFFYVHTDWMTFAKTTLKLDIHNTDRVRRMFRAFYRNFDGLLLLNSDQLNWFASDSMGIELARLRQTAHWANPCFNNKRTVLRSQIIPELNEHDRVILFVGRVSDEKGVSELPALIKSLRAQEPNTRLVIVGSGPAETKLKTAIKEALFLSWVDADKLADIYKIADVLVLPSRFDTFGCVVVEALASGLPVVAYKTMGPKDIIKDGVCGYTVEHQEEFAPAVLRILK